jgi:hypothetical protein
MSILNINVSLTSYNSTGSGCSLTNNPSQLNFKWNRAVSGIPSDNVLSQSETIPVSSSSTLFSGATVYSFIYLETDSQLTLLINGTITQIINPIIVNGSTFPGIFMCNSDITSVVVTNSSATNPADIFYAIAE